MVSKLSFSRNLLNRFAIAASVVTLFTLPYAAQAQTGTAVEGGQQYSSSADWKAYLSSYDFDGAPGATATPQYGQYGRNNNYPYQESRWSHLAFEAGAGFTAPIGNDVSGGKNAGLAGYDTWGYNVTFGAGWNFTKHIGALLEYQFNRNKIPGDTLAALGVPGGNINTWSLTLDPIIYLPLQTHSFGTYVTGGGGFYRKVTNYTEPAQACYFDYYYGYVCGYQNETVYHFSSNQGGMNIGAGIYWKAFGPDSNAKLYAEARYVWVNSPGPTAEQPLGEGTEGLIPVTFGIRF